MQGAGRWADFGDAWLCAHDLMHHAAGGRGRLHEEMCTYGVEAWICGADRAEGWALSDFSSIAGPVKGAYRGTKSLRTFSLPEPPPVSVAVTGAQLAHWTQIVEEGFAEASMGIASRYDSRYGREMPQAELDLLVCEENQRRAVAWIAHGFVQAQKRYPDPRAALALWNAVYTFFQNLGAGDRQPGFKSFQVLFDERQLAFSPCSPKLRQAWARAQAEAPAREH